MSDGGRTLNPSAARAYYDRFGKKQDSQGFYEDPALDDLIAHSDFQDARSVFEFGCGTGKLAARLLGGGLRPSAGYLGCDISPVMIELAKQRLAVYGGRAQVVLADGAVRFPLPDQSVDRVVSSYVLDLLSEEDIRCFFAEAFRVLTPHGRVCLASLTRGFTPLSRIVASIWTAVFKLRPAMVGGCRPVVLDSYVDAGRWRVVHRSAVAPFGVPSEVLILAAERAPGDGTAAAVAG